MLKPLGRILNFETGQAVELKCTLSRPVSNICWYHGTLPLQSCHEEFRNRVETEEIINPNNSMTVIFRITKCYRRDRDKITLFGEESMLNQVEVNIADELEIPIRFERKLTDETAILGDDVTLTCKVTDKLCLVSWFRHNDPIQSCDKYKFSCRGLERSLKISNVTKEDQAVYVCKMKEHLTIYTECELKVEFPLIKMLRKLRSVEVFQGEDVIQYVELDSQMVELEHLKICYDGDPIDKYVDDEGNHLIEVTKEVSNTINNSMMAKDAEECTLWKIKVPGDLVKCTYTGHSLSFEVTDQPNCTTTCQIQPKETPLKSRQYYL